MIAAEKIVTRFKWAGVAFLLFLGWAIAAASLSGTSMTADEPNHFNSALRMLKGDFRFLNDADIGKMPVSVLNVLPARLLKPKILEQDIGGNDFEAVKMGRHVTLFFSVLLGLLVFLWSEKLYGTPAGFLALILYNFSPLLLAHRRYVTNDLFAGLMLFSSMYSLWCFCRYGRRKQGVLTGVLIGLAQLVKYSSVWIYPVAVITMAVSRFKETGCWRGALKHTVIWGGNFVLITVLVLNLAYGFRDSFKPVGKHVFKSSFFKKIQQAAPSSLPVPVPEAWLQRLDDLVDADNTGRGYGPVYLLGKFQRVNKTGFPGHYFWAYLFKEPIGAQALLLTAFIFYVKRRREFRFWRDEWFLIVPVVYYSVYLNYFVHAQIGLRYGLPVFPFLYVLTASLLKNAAAAGRKLRAWIEIMLLYMIISVMSYYPAFLPYMNEIVWDRSKAYKYLLDSNLHWWMEYWPLFQDKLKKLPPKPTHYNPAEPVKGRIIFDLGGYLFSPHPEKLRWFLDHYKPVDHAGYAYWIYEID